MKIQGNGAKKSSQGISMSFKKEKASQKKSFYSIEEAANRLIINEMVFRQFLWNNIFSEDGIPKEKFLKKGYFITYSKKVNLPLEPVYITKIQISESGINFLKFLIKIKNEKRN
jgi:hypothetical protein